MDAKQYLYILMCNIQLTDNDPNKNVTNTIRKIEEYTRLDDLTTIVYPTRVSRLTTKKSKFFTSLLGFCTREIYIAPKIDF